MKKKIFVLGVCAFMLCGCGKTIPTLENGEQAVVTFENGDKISVNDLYTKVKDSYALQSLLQMIDQYILEKEYADEVETMQETAESTIKAMKENYGEEQLLQILQSSGFSSIESYQNAYYINALQNLAIVDYGKAQVTDKEIEKYYKESVFGDIQISHILITADTTSTMTSEEKTEAETKAKETAEGYIQEIQNSEDKKAKFEEIAKAYSKDDSTKDNGGNLGYVNIGTLSTAYDELVKAAQELKDGEISKTVLTTELGYHIIYRDNQKEKASLDDTRESIRETLGNKKLQNDGTMSITALTELRKKYGMEIVDSEIQKQYGNYISNTIAAIENSASSTSAN